MKICLINPPKIRIPSSNFISNLVDIGIPVGLLMIGATLEKEGHEVKIIDCLVDGNVQFKKINENKYIYGCDNESLLQLIKDYSPNIIGVTSQFTAQSESLISTIKLIKQNFINIPIIVGGADISSRPKLLMQECKEIDFGVIGEGEKTIIEILKHLEGKLKSLNHIKNIIFKNKSDLVITDRDYIEDIDSLPLPAYHLIDMEKYLNLPQKGIYFHRRSKLRSAYIITSRGCPFDCVFCATHSMMGKKFRKNSVNYILDHIDLLVKNYKIEQLYFEDDNFTLDMERCKKILDGIIERKYKFKLILPNGVRADKVDEEFIKKFKTAGGIQLIIAAESGSQYVLDKIINKGLKLDDIIRVAKLCKQEKLPLIVFFIIGLPGETKENILETEKFALKLIKEYNANIPNFFIATPFYGTRLYDLCKKNNFLKGEITPERLSTSLSIGGLIETKEWDSKYLCEINTQFMRKAYYYLLKQRIYHPIKLIKRVIETPYALKYWLIRFIKGSEI